jgi:hypothetical protein
MVFLKWQSQNGYLKMVILKLWSQNDCLKMIVLKWVTILCSGQFLTSFRPGTNLHTRYVSKKKHPQMSTWRQFNRNCQYIHSYSKTFYPVKVCVHCVLALQFFDTDGLILLPLMQRQTDLRLQPMSLYHI